DQGIPSLLRRARGFDVPDFLAAGPRDVLVPESGYERAREVLLGADLLTNEAPSDSLPGIGSPLRLAVGVIVSVGIAALVVYLLYLASSGAARPRRVEVELGRGAEPTVEVGLLERIGERPRIERLGLRVEDLVQVHPPGALDHLHPRLEGELEVALRSRAVQPGDE